MEPENLQIICTDDWIMTYITENDDSGYLYKFYFANQTWQMMHCKNLPNFIDYSMVMLGRRLLVIHGTTDQNRNIYKTYIGDVTQYPATEFQHIASLETPRYMSNGEQRIVMDEKYLYALVGYKIKGSKETSVYRLDRGVSCNWTILYKGTSEDSQRNYYNPTWKQGIIYYDRKIIIVLPDGRNELDNVSHLSVFDLRTNVWLQLETAPSDFSSWLSNVNEFSVAQCPIDPRHVYVQCFYRASSTQWCMWHLNLDELRWEQIWVLGPQVFVFGNTSSAITPSGCLYTVRKFDPFNQRDKECYLVYTAMIRSPRLEELAFQTLAEDMIWRVRHGERLRLDVIEQLPRSLALRFLNAWRNRDEQQ